MAKPQCDTSLVLFCHAEISQTMMLHAALLVGIKSFMKILSVLIELISHIKNVFTTLWANGTSYTSKCTKRMGIPPSIRVLIEAFIN